MIVVADASALVAELLRTRGRALLAHPDLRVVVAEEQWNETQHELQRRISTIVEQGRLTEEHAKRLHSDVLALVDERVIEIIPRRFYQHMEAVARRRVPRDPRDWPPVALALVLDAGILTADRDFLGCGCATWTAETLCDELGLSGP
ncbi:MAG: PIN domain-containing protein [Pseudonocardiaceae bacterium]